MERTASEARVLDGRIRYDAVKGPKASLEVAVPRFGGHKRRDARVLRAHRQVVERRDVLSAFSQLLPHTRGEIRGTRAARTRGLMRTGARKRAGGSARRLSTHGKLLPTTSTPAPRTPARRTPSRSAALSSAPYEEAKKAGLARKLATSCSTHDALHTRSPSSPHAASSRTSPCLVRSAPPRLKSPASSSGTAGGGGQKSVSSSSAAFPQSAAQIFGGRRLHA